VVGGIVGALGVCLVSSAWAYIDQPAENFTLPRLLLEFRSAGLFEVERVDLEKGAIRFRFLELFQGLAPTDGINHTITFDGRIPPELRNVKVGQKAVLFRDDPYARAVTMLEGTWYVSSWDRSTGWSRISQMANAFFEYGFCGSVPELAEACKTLLKGESVVVRCRKKKDSPETMLVSCSLREPHRRVALTGPGEKPAPSGSAAPQANVAALLVTLRSEKADDRRTAATALARLGDQARAAVPALVAAFPQEKDTFARRAMVVALGQIGPGARDAVPSLVVALRDGYSSADDLVGFEASVALAKIDPDGAVTAQLLTAMLRDKNDDVRRRAAGVLRMVGPVLKNAVPVLIEAAKDRHSEVRAEAVRSLAALRPDPGLAVPVLATAVRDSDKYVRQYAATALATFGPEAKGALKALIEAVAAEKDPEARAQEIRALRYMGPAAAEAIPVLTEALKDPSKDVRAQAEKALKRIRPEPPKPAAPAKPGA